MWQKDVFESMVCKLHSQDLLSAAGPRQSFFLSALPSWAADQWAFTHLNEPSVCARAYDCAGTLRVCTNIKRCIFLHNYEVKAKPIIQYIANKTIYYHSYSS